MFDIGFWELAIIAVVGLVVIGPERLPDVARTVGRWVGAARRFIGNVKADIDREIQQEELKKAIERDAGLDEIKEIMNTDRFTLEEEDIRFDEEPEDLVKVTDDVEPKNSNQEASQQVADETQQDDQVDSSAPDKPAS